MNRRRFCADTDARLRSLGCPKDNPAQRAHRFQRIIDQRPSVMAAGRPVSHDLGVFQGRPMSSSSVLQPDRSINTIPAKTAAFQR